MGSVELVLNLSDEGVCFFVMSCVLSVVIMVLLLVYSDSGGMCRVMFVVFVCF